MNAANDNHNQVTFQAALFRFLTEAQLLIERHYAKSNVEAPILDVDMGRKYIRVSAELLGLAHAKSAYCFIDMKNGNVLKPDGWKKPARGIRGNIFKPDHGIGAVGPYGALNCR